MLNLWWWFRRNDVGYGILYILKVFVGVGLGGDGFGRLGSGGGDVVGGVGGLWGLVV